MAARNRTFLPADPPPPDIPPEPSANPRQDVEETMRLLSWARANGWSIPALRVGSVELSVRDLNPKYGKQEPAQSSQPTEPNDIWKQYRPPGADEEQG